MLTHKENLQIFAQVGMSVLLYFSAFQILFSTFSSLVSLCLLRGLIVVLKVTWFFTKGYLHLEVPKLVLIGGLNRLLFISVALVYKESDFNREFFS